MDNDTVQLELFSQVKKGADAKIQNQPSFIYSVRAHEKTIILIILFVITGVISFSLGVERGKVIANQDIRINNLDIVKNTPKITGTNQLVTTQAAPLALKIDPPKATLKPTPNENPVLANFTIQIASYQLKSSAEKDAQTLKKRGLVTLVLLKGNHTVLCVGKFPDKQTAKATLTELKKQFHDCFIRRI